MNSEDKYNQQQAEKRNITTEGGNYNERIKGNYIDQEGSFGVGINQGHINIFTAKPYWLMFGAIIVTFLISSYSSFRVQKVDLEYIEPLEKEVSRPSSHNLEKKPPSIIPGLEPPD